MLISVLNLFLFSKSSLNFINVAASISYSAVSPLQVTICSGSVFPYDDGFLSGFLETIDVAL